MSFKKCGRIWKVGDNVPNDGGLMPLSFAVNQIYDLQELKKHCFEEWRPSLATQIKQGDLLVTGRNFAYGHIHIYGFLGLKGLRIGGILTESMGRASYRAAIDTGIPVLCCPRPPISKRVKEGDIVEVDFETGHIKDLTSGQELWYEPLPKLLLDIVKAGGGEEYITQRLNNIIKPRKLGRKHKKA